MARKKIEPIVEPEAEAAPPVKMKKPKKKEVPEVKITAAKAAYVLAIEALAAAYEEYSQGNAQDSLFTTPGKQKKVAKQIAKLHNRLQTKSKLAGDMLDEE